MKLYENYLSTEDETFVRDTLATAALSNSENDIACLPSGITDEEAQRNLEQVHSIYAMLNVFSLFMPEADGVGTMVGDSICFIEPLDDMSAQECRHLRSPRLSRNKLLTANPRLLARIIHSVLSDRDSWVLGGTQDASRYFSPSPIPSNN